MVVLHLLPGLRVCDVAAAGGGTGVQGDIVDLDGARSGETNNFSVIKKIREQFPDIFIQVGGGIRSEEDIEKYLNIGVNKLIIGTKALRFEVFTPRP